MQVVMRSVVCVAMVLTGAGAALATPYWVTWEGNDYPENEGWEHVWGNFDGPYQGPGADRSLDGGIMTVDTLADPLMYDGYRMSRPGQFDAGPGETFIMEWRMLIEEANGNQTEGCAVGLLTDDARVASLWFRPYQVDVPTDDYQTATFEPYVWHSYRLVSSDMLSFDLYIDDVWSLSAQFTVGADRSFVAWGNQIQGGSARVHWDYVRFGVVPEPNGLLLVCVLSLVWRRAGFLREGVQHV